MGAAYSAETREWLAGTDLSERKSLGQYMTPRPIRDSLIDRLELSPGMRVLDPGVGTGEFLASIAEREPSASLTGWDADPRVLEYAARAVPGAALRHRSALDPYDGEPFDLVIGNPPYFQFRATPQERERFRRVISGRPNIFALFFQASVEATKPGGRVAFVVPPSMNNGAYFEALRNFLVEASSIEHLEVLEGNDLFEDASTAAQLIVIRVGDSGGDFHLRRTCPEAGFSRTIFSTDPAALEREFEGRETLWDLGFEAVTGTVVWNQHRERLVRSEGRGAVPLIWSHNIESGEVVLATDHKRPQYVLGQEPLRGPALVVNRVVGAVGRGELRAALVPEGMEFVAENHVNVIRARPAVSQRLAWEDLLAAMSSPGIASRVRRLTGNTQISAKELTHLLPLSSPRRA
jgi:adenine-specific DNA-methyltransferase